MIQHCKSTPTTHKYSFLLFLFIMTFFLPLILQQLPLFVTTLFLVSLDYFTSREFYNCIYSSLFPSSTIIIQNATISIKNTRKPVLLINTSTTITTKDKELIITDNDSQRIVLASPESIEPAVFNKSFKKRRHYSVSSHSDIDFFNKTPELSPSASSVSSFSSNWIQGRRPSQVEEMIYLFESGVQNQQPKRRYSVDSHSYQHKQLIRERKFEYKPIVSEWEKRVNSPIQLSVSKSTPVRRKMPPILEKSKSTWA